MCRAFCVLDTTESQILLSKEENYAEFSYRHITQAQHDVRLAKEKQNSIHAHDIIFIIYFGKIKLTKLLTLLIKTQI